MAICTLCGKINVDATHECNEAEVMISEKARETAQAALISEGKIEIVDERPKKKEV